ncbi:hypothetical protein Cal6303_1010 [Calothrix sp. PCC 6303]|nr:hypothetical protein Cal6303_1010 [Calothrix sp. PCC 6303]
MTWCFNLTMFAGLSPLRGLNPRQKTDSLLIRDFQIKNIPKFLVVQASCLLLIQGQARLRRERSVLTSGTLRSDRLRNHRTLPIPQYWVIFICGVLLLLF